MCPDVLSLFSIKHQGIFLLEVKKNMAQNKKLNTILGQMNYHPVAHMNQYDLICYTSKIYSEYKQRWGTADLQIQDMRYKDKDSLKNVCKEINSFIRNTSLMNRYKQCIEDFHNAINNFSLNMSQSFTSSGRLKWKNKVFNVGNEQIVYKDLDQLITAVLELMPQISGALDSKDIQRLSNIVSKAGHSKYNFEKGIEGWLNSIIDKFTEFTDEIYKDQNIEIYPTGSVTYGQISSRFTQPIQKLKNELNSNISVPDVYLNAQQKIDQLITYNNTTYTVSLKSHWRKGGQQPVTIQGAPQRLAYILSLSSLYGINTGKNKGYWMFLNDALYNNVNWTMNKIRLVYASYFGNVDFLGEWYYEQMNEEIIPQLKMYTKEEIIQYLYDNNKIKLEGEGTFNLMMNWQNSDINHNENLVLYNIRVAALTDLSLSNII